jgi:cell division protein FtsQ
MVNDPNTKSSLHRLLWIGGGFLLVVLITSAVERKRAMPVAATVVEVEPLAGGSYLIDSADVIKIIGRSFGMSLDEQAAGLIDVDRVERVLEEDPFVLNAEAMLTANSKVKINVQQREPILRVMDNLGAQYYLDKNGARVPLSKHFTARTLVATGNIPPHTPEFLTKKRHAMKDLFTLTNFILADDFWRAMIEQIHVNSKEEYILIPKLGDQAVILGKYDENMEAKFKKLKTFYQEGMPYEGWQKYRTIDLRYRNQVVCERR